MRKVLLASLATGALFLYAVGGAAAAPFLCPIVRDGTTNAPGLAPSGPAATTSIAPPAGASLLPGNNQAGDHANSNAYNSNGAGTPIAGNVPGSDGYTPIWTGP